ncbi:hypothetical protein BGZ73_004486 [Actinomortierella ambigua]|nr:hypothetical protein BGZ73_004486 [Actinomortierella ambigua]
MAKAAKSEMKRVNTTCAAADYPIFVQHSDTLGNHATASRNISQGERILKALPYAAEAFDSYRKRMCHTCLLYQTRSTFKHRCQDCDQVYYCSDRCKTIGMDPTSGCHPKLCRSLRRLATWDSDRHTKSIIKLYLQILLSHWRERQGLRTPYQHHQQMLKEEEKEKEERKKERQEQDEHGEQQSRAEDSEDQNKTSLLTKESTHTDADLPQDQASLSLSLSDHVEAQLCISSAPIPESENQSPSSPQPIENTFEDVQALQSHVEDWDEEEHQDWNKQAQVVLSLLEMAGLTEMKVAVDREENSQDEGEEKETQERQITAEDIKFTVSALESNCFGMFDRSRKKHCNATAVQADGAQDVTGEDVLGVIAQEDAAKASAAAAVNATPATPSSAVSSTVSSPLEKADQIPKAESTDGTTTPTTETEEIASDEVTATSEDPFESMVGEFRAMSFFAMRDISQGKDVTISYIDSDMPLQARRLALMSDYHFHCCCERCVREETAQKATKAKVSRSSKKIAASKAAKKKK